jgi:hypothetical protein
MSKYFVSRLLAGFIVGTLWLVPGPQAAADDPAVKSVVRTRTSEVTIQSKTSVGLVTKELRVVRISGDTKYVDQNGKKIDLESLEAPCKAVIEYEPVPQGDHEAVSVTVKQRLPGATRLTGQTPQ